MELVSLGRIQRKDAAGLGSLSQPLENYLVALIPIMVIFVTAFVSTLR